MGKYERDLELVNEILSKTEITHEDRLRLLTVYKANYHNTGKIAGISSCDSSCNGCTFCAKMRKAAESDPSIICGKCYDAKQEKYKINVQKRHTLNLRIMSNVLFTVDELRTVATTDITRINSSGDLENDTHGRNMVRFGWAHPESMVSLWAKNQTAAKHAFDAEGKPKNMRYIASSIRIDCPIPFPEYADNTFTVYSTPEKLAEAVARGAGECNGKKCEECGKKCYKADGWKHGQDIAELLRN